LAILKFKKKKKPTWAAFAKSGDFWPEATCPTGRERFSCCTIPVVPPQWCTDDRPEETLCGARDGATSLRPSCIP